MVHQSRPWGQGVLNDSFLKPALKSGLANQKFVGHDSGGAIPQTTIHAMICERKGEDDAVVAR